MCVSTILSMPIAAKQQQEIEWPTAIYIWSRCVSNIAYKQ